MSPSTYIIVPSVAIPTCTAPGVAPNPDQCRPWKLQIPPLATPYRRPFGPAAIEVTLGVPAAACAQAPFLYISVWLSVVCAYTYWPSGDAAIDCIVGPGADTHDEPFHCTASPAFTPQIDC